MTAIKRILLIDDEEVILFGFKKVLSDPAVAVDTASTVDDAKNLFKKNTYAAAIIDLRLSNSSGLEGIDLVTAIKSVQNNCWIIVLTAYGDDEVKRRAVEAGADLFLEKPVKPTAIKKCLETMGLFST